jgi:hypothetical protein
MWSESADVETCVVEFAEQLGLPCASVVEGDIDDAVGVGRFLDAWAKQDADVAPAYEAEEVAHFEDDVLASAWLGGCVAGAGAVVVWGEDDDGVGDLSGVVFEFLDQRAAEAGLLAQNDGVVLRRGLRLLRVGCRCRGQ